MRVFLVRHGQTAWNLAGRAQGQTDVELDDLGVLQAEALAHSFAKGSIRTILSSDLKRAVQTAEPLAERLGLSVHQRRELRERSFGTWEGIPFSEVHMRLDLQAGIHGESVLHARPPGGESFADVWSRLDPVVNELRAASEPVIVVTHGGTASLLAARLVQGTLATSRAFRFSNTGIMELVLRNEGIFTIFRYNDIQHLGALANQHPTPKTDAVVG